MSATEYDAVELGVGAELAPFPRVRLVADPASPANWAPTLRYHGWRRHVKRLLDVGIVLAALPVALPLMLGVAAVVKWRDRGPAIYRQDRVGQYGKTFRIFKFRTMYTNADQMLRNDHDLYASYVGNDYKLPNDVDPRVTRVGRFLRNTSLDELPQLFNVLGGSMSLVGPRPIVREELVRYGDPESSYL